MAQEQKSLWVLLKFHLKNPLKCLDELAIRCVCLEDFEILYRFPYFNLWNRYPFIYLQSEKGTPFGWSLPVESIIGSAPPRVATPCLLSILSFWVEGGGGGEKACTYLRLVRE